MWIAAERSYNFAIYSKYAESVTLLLYEPGDLLTPIAAYRFDPFRNKTGRVWHARLHKDQVGDAQSDAYSMSGPAPSGNRFERHAFDPRKILLDPYAKAVFVPPNYDRRAAIGPGSNAGRALLGILLGEQQDFDWGDEVKPIGKTHQDMG
jgi:isoamylase